MRCLIIDNYDSFTWNLADYIAQSFGTVPTIVRNDDYGWNELLAKGPYDCIIVSPGPGSVTNPGDFNVSKNALEQTTIPVLGVCLGHQGLAHVYGATIEHAPVPFHGRQSAIHHDGSEMFVGLPPTFLAVRYHSLVVNPNSIPDELQVTARSTCGLIMGLRHRSQPKWGVQFHPESILTANGMQIIQNFRDAVKRYAQAIQPKQVVSDAVKSPASKLLVNRPVSNPAPAPKLLHAFSRRLSCNVDSEAVFIGLYGNRRYSAWLDGYAPGDDNAQFSFMGAPADDDVATYQLKHGRLAAERHLSLLDGQLERTRVCGGEDLPFEFRGGYVGYMTYEMKAAFGASARHRNAMPDSVWMLLDRFIAFDHKTRDIWLVAIAEASNERDVQAWMDEIAATIATLPALLPDVRRPSIVGPLGVAMDFDHADYLAAIEACKQKIVDGESYEICLTNNFNVALQVDPLDLYRTMRKGNAAPYSTFLRVGEHSILSTSPERFLKVDSHGTIQTKPIKGTAARSDDPARDELSARNLTNSEKDRAENLMIVDLMRNDLARVSEPGSVSVPKLMSIESFKTVHQMVSTVESKLDPECSLIELLRAVFPGGSITGAPKIRTMEILDTLERSSRGVYCGSIGYLGFNRIADLNIAIRTMSYDGHALKFGAGGAITYLSEPESEFDEILLKAEALLRPIRRHLALAACSDNAVHGQSVFIENNPSDFKTAHVEEKRGDVRWLIPNA